MTHCTLPKQRSTPPLKTRTGSPDIRCLQFPNRNESHAAGLAVIETAEARACSLEYLHRSMMWLRQMAQLSTWMSAAPGGE